MIYAIEFHLDKQSEHQVRTLWERMEQNGLPNFLYQNCYIPHLTLSVFSHVDIEKFTKRLKNFAEDNCQFDLEITNIGVFPLPSEVGIFLNPTPTEDLLAVHRSLHKLFEDFLEFQQVYYLPGRWNAHCTLAVNLPKDKLAKAMELTLDAEYPMKMTINSIALVAYQPAEVLCEFELQK